MRGRIVPGRLAQLVRALGSHPRGRRFESFTAHHLAWKDLILDKEMGELVLAPPLKIVVLSSASDYEQRPISVSTEVMFINESRDALTFIRIWLGNYPV